MLQLSYHDTELASATTAEGVAGNSSIFTPTSRPAWCKFKAITQIRWCTYFCRGPSDVWHIDGYDELRPYRILISG